MSGDVFNIRDESNIERLVGTINDPQATTGHVLTVQSDKSIKAAAGGGSVPIKVVRFAIAHDTPNLVLTGTPIYTPAAGELIGGFYYTGGLSITTGFDGSTPTLHYGVAGALTDYDAILDGNSVISTPNGVINAHAASIALPGAPSGSIIALDTEPVTAMVDDGSGGDPGSTVGAGEIVLLIVAAP